MILWICIGIFAALLILGAPILLCLGLPPVIWLLQDGFLIFVFDNGMCSDAPDLAE